MKKKHTILIVPPRGIAPKSVRIKFSVVVLTLVIALVGLIGFLVPLKTVTNTIEEQNQQKNLSRQNKALLQKIATSLRMLQNVRNKISYLENKKQHIQTISGIQSLQKIDSIESLIDYSSMEPSELLKYINRVESVFNIFKNSIENERNVFDTLPILYPAGKNAYLSRNFGIVSDPFSGKKRFHHGIDFIAPVGNPIYATASGIVLKIEKHPLWGNRITIKHSSMYSTVYAHVGKVKTSRGKKVARGEKIGEIGMSGLSSGPHIHYEVLCSGERVDPEEYLFPVHAIVMYR